MSKYVENRTIHDADTHVMEMPDKIEEYLEKKYIEDFRSSMVLRGFETAGFIEEGIADQKDPAFREGAEENLMKRKLYSALGATDNEDRVQALDLLGFSSQLVFSSTGLNNYGFEYNGKTELALATARAHNRMMTDFCNVDPRLLATGYVPLVDMKEAPIIAREALDLGCKMLLIPSRCPTDHSHSHIDLYPLWELAQEAGVPIGFHLGSEDKATEVYHKNGLPRVADVFGGDENFTSTTLMHVPCAVWKAMSLLIFDGVLDRYPQLQFASVEMGASWVPSWMRWMELCFNSFYKREERLQSLSARPSEIAQKRFKVTPFFGEDVGWTIDNSGEEMLMFASDYPHLEGGSDPLKYVSRSIEHCSDIAKENFFRNNFIKLMGKGLDSSLHDHPSVKAA